MNFAVKLRQDELLDRVIRNSAHLFSSNAAGLVLSVLQGILAARMLGPAGYGLVGIVMSYASTINGLLSFRMGELVVRYGGEYLEHGEHDRAAALIKLSALSEASVSVVAFLVVSLSAGMASRIIAKSPGIEWMFVLFSLGLLCNFNAETATGVLQITNKIKLRGTINFIQAVFSAGVIVALFVWNERTDVNTGTALLVVLCAYLLGKAILGLGLLAAAWSQVGRLLGPGWRRADIRSLPSVREMMRFGLTSNLSATGILVFRESEVLWVGLFLSNEAAGLYKVAYMIVGLLSVPADPLILSVFPEMNRLVVQRAWLRLKAFLRSVTTLAFLFNIAIGLVFIVFGRLVLAIFGNQYVVAYPAMLALLAGLVFNYTLFWNRPLLLSLGLQGFALGAIVLAGVVKLGLGFALVPRFGYVMEAGLLSAYYLISVGLIVWRGQRELGRRMALPAESHA